MILGDIITAENGVGATVVATLTFLITRFGPTLISKMSSVPASRVYGSTGTDAPADRQVGDRCLDHESRLTVLETTIKLEIPGIKKSVEDGFDHVNRKLDDLRKRA